MLEQELINSLLKDKKSDRRWRNLRFAGWMFILILYAILIFAPSGASFTHHAKKDNYVALVRLQGVILPDTHFSAEYVIPQLTRAFMDKNAKGVILLINSPGGSPVQASIIHDKILELKQRYHKKVVVLGEDTLASGAYLVATAADNIYVNRDTLTGSIGVIMSGFGFTDAIQKLGITRRVFTAGDNKDRLDPFENLKPEDQIKVKKVLDQVHQDFINDVIQGRGKRLSADQKILFSGDFWTGGEAVKLGLADGTANLWNIAHDQFKVDLYRDYSAKESFVQSLLKNMNSELNIHLENHLSPLRAQVY